MLSYLSYFEIIQQKWSICVSLLNTYLCKMWLQKVTVVVNIFAKQQRRSFLWDTLYSLGLYLFMRIVKEFTEYDNLKAKYITCREEFGRNLSVDSSVNADTIEITRFSYRMTTHRRLQRNLTIVLMLTAVHATTSGWSYPAPSPRRTWWSKK